MALQTSDLQFSGQIINQLITALESSPRCDKLPAALFDRMLSSLFDGHLTCPSAFDLSNFAHINNWDVLFTDDITTKNRAYVRLLIRLFGVLCIDDRCSETALLVGKRFFTQTLFELFSQDNAVLSTWLQTCTGIASKPESRAWLYSNKCVPIIVCNLKHDNVYVCRNAAKATSALLKYLALSDNEDLERGTDLLSVLVGTVIQFGFDCGRPTGESQSPNARVSENTTFECARLVVEFTDRLFLQGMTPDLIRSLYKVTFSNEECSILFRIAANFKRLTDCCVALFCVFSSNFAIPVSDAFAAKVALRRLRIAELTSPCSEENYDECWNLALQPVKGSSVPSHYRERHIAAVADFLDNYNSTTISANRCLTFGSDMLFQACLCSIQQLFNTDSSQSLLLSLLDFIRSTVRVLCNLSVFYLEKCTEACLLEKMFDNIDRVVHPSQLAPSDQVATKIVKTCASILVELWNGFSRNSVIPQPTLVKQTERFVELCIVSERLCTHNTNVGFTFVEALLSFTKSFTSYMDNPNQASLKLIISLLKGWTSVACDKLSRCISDANYADIINAYSHSSRFVVLAYLILTPLFFEDKAVISKVFIALPLKKLAEALPHTFPAMKRSFVGYFFAVAHLPQSVGSCSQEADFILTGMLQDLDDASDHYISNILHCWSLKCRQHLSDNFSYRCERKVKADVGSFKASPDGSNNNKVLPEDVCVKTALRICKDVLAFLEADDLPCVFIGSADGCQDMLDCEES